MERAKRIELSSQPWQGRVLPLNHARKNGFDYPLIIANLDLTYKSYFFFDFRVVVADLVFAAVFLRACGPKSWEEIAFK